MRKRTPSDPPPCSVRCVFASLAAGLQYYAASPPSRWMWRCQAWSLRPSRARGFTGERPCAWLRQRHQASELCFAIGKPIGANRRSAQFWPWPPLQNRGICRAVKRFPGRTADVHGRRPKDLAQRCVLRQGQARWAGLPVLAGATDSPWVLLCACFCPRAFFRATRSLHCVCAARVAPGRRPEPGGGASCLSLLALALPQSAGFCQRQALLDRPMDVEAPSWNARPASALVAAVVQVDR